MFAAATTHRVDFLGVVVVMALWAGGALVLRRGRERFGGRGCRRTDIVGVGLTADAILSPHCAILLRV